MKQVPAHSVKVIASGLYIDNDGDIFYQEITYTDGEWLP